ncbi:hypothetical protein BC826DRAFT_1103107 [Russula brevipes]|nr:hypothetical protein BC826DRAFT_1103107 [Russula brevipes]
MPHGHGRNGSHPVRPHQPVQAQVRRTGSTPDLRRGASTPTIQSSTQGVGLSLIDNGAFEAPRPAPEPRTHAENKPGLPSRTAPRRGPPAALKIPAEDDETPASYLVIADSPPAFRALSFRRHIRSKKQKQPPRSDSPGGGHLRPAGSSESDLNSSFFSILEGDAKPQRKGLFFKKKT